MQALGSVIACNEEAVCDAVGPGSISVFVAKFVPDGGANDRELVARHADDFRGAVVVNRLGCELGEGTDPIIWIGLGQQSVDDRQTASTGGNFGLDD